MGTVTVNVTVEDRSGNRAVRSVGIETRNPVRGGYYLSGNGDVRPDITGMNCRSITQYRSFADASVFPGWQKEYLKDLGATGVLLNYVLELKYYGAAVGAQNFSVAGQSYSVPAPNMTTQQRSGTTWPKSYGYSQVLAGQVDGVLHRAAHQLNLMGGTYPVNIQLASEFDTDHEFGITDGGFAYGWIQADARALSALDYMLTYLKSKITRPNVTFSIGMGGFDRSSWQRIHTEAIMARVDYMQFNVYRRSASDTAYGRFMRTKAWSDVDLGTIAKNKPIIVAEWGTPMSLNDQATWIRTVPAAIEQINDESATAKIVVANYFNSNDGWATLNPKAEGLAALRDAYGSSPFAV